MHHEKRQKTHLVELYKNMIATTHVSMILPIYIIFSLLKSCNPDLQHLAFSMHQLLHLQILSHLNISRKVVTF